MKKTHQQQNHPALFEIEMGIGSWQWGDKLVWGFGNNYAESEIENAFIVSMDKNLKMVDTAEIYGNGKSERILGGLIKKTGYQPFIASKFFPWPWRWTKKSVIKAFTQSLERIDQPKMHLYQIHWPSPISPVETQLDGIAELHKEGLTDSIGVSNFNKTQMQRAITALSKHNIPLASNQVEYNLLNRTIEKNGLLQRCDELGVRVIAYSPIAMGLLSGKYTKETPPPGFRANKYAALLGNLQPLIKLMAEIGQDQGSKTVSQIAINWCICKGTLPIPGAKNYQQAENNAGAKDWYLTSDQVAALDKASDIYSKISD
jgi:aryl-alcohol dehydrogenase-like predicted oxidoreductase